MKQMEAPLCRVCEQRHWLREPHSFGKDLQREGRDVLKGAKPTSSAPTGKPNPLQPPARSMAEDQTKADKVAPGKRKTARKAKRRKAKA